MAFNPTLHDARNQCDNSKPDQVIAMRWRRTDFARLGLALPMLCIVGSGMAKDNSPIVNNGVKEFYRINRSAGLKGLIARVQNCWSEVESKKTQEAIAFCFALDYSTSTFDELTAKKQNLPQSDFTKIEKT